MKADNQERARSCGRKGLARSQGRQAMAESQSGIARQAVMKCQVGKSRQARCKGWQAYSSRKAEKSRHAREIRQRIKRRQVSAGRHGKQAERQVGRQG